MIGAEKPSAKKITKDHQAQRGVKALKGNENMYWVYTRFKSDHQVFALIIQEIFF